MKIINRWVLVACATLLSVLAVPSPLRADIDDKATKLTFSGPVEVPGMTLPAGTYFFTLADSDSDRNIVEIWNADRSRLITTVLAIPDYRLKPKGHTVIKFEERPSGSPEAIHSWFYPGSSFGEEFVYPKTRAVQLAKQTSRPVLSVREDVTPQPAKPAELKKAPVKAVTPSGEEIEIAEIVATQPEMPQLASAASPQPSKLPKTASSLPLLILIGLLSLAAAGVFRLTVRWLD